MALPESNFTLEEVKKLQTDIRENIGLEDMRVGALSTDAPTTNTIDKGRFRFVELSGVPYLYYRTINGTVYKFAGVPA